MEAHRGKLQRRLTAGPVHIVRHPQVPKAPGRGGQLQDLPVSHVFSGDEDAGAALSQHGRTVPDIMLPVPPFEHREQIKIGNDTKHQSVGLTEARSRKGVLTHPLDIICQIVHRSFLLSRPEVRSGPGSRPQKTPQNRRPDETFCGVFPSYSHIVIIPARPENARPWLRSREVLSAPDPSGGV